MGASVNDRIAASVFSATCRFCGIHHQHAVRSEERHGSAAGRIGVGRIEALRPMQHEEIRRHLLRHHDFDLVPRRLVASRKRERAFAWRDSRDRDIPTPVLERSLARRRRQKPHTTATTRFSSCFRSSFVRHRCRVRIVGACPGPFKIHLLQTEQWSALNGFNIARVMAVPVLHPTVAEGSDAPRAATHLT